MPQFIQLPHGPRDDYSPLRPRSTGGVTTLLLVDDDRDVVALLTFSLTRAGFSVVAAHDTPTALQLLEREHPDLAVLDVDLGRWSGLDLLLELRKVSDIPVIMLTGMGAEQDRLTGFERGADDYVVKPFSHHEVIARIKAQLKRRGQTVAAPALAQTLLQVGPITLNVTEHAATRNGAPLNLTVTEFRILHYLMTRPSAVVPKPELMQQVWGHTDPSGTEAVRIAVHRLRRKLEEDPARPRLLHTIAGVGLMLKPEAPQATPQLAA